MILIALVVSAEEPTSYLWRSLSSGFDLFAQKRSSSANPTDKADGKGALSPTEAVHENELRLAVL